MILAFYFLLNHLGDGKLNDGATVYVDIGRKNVIDGKIYAICHGGLFKFKYLYRMPMGGIRIVSANSDEYKDF